MIEEKDIWRSANVLIKQHGDDAWFHAAQRADEMLAKGDVEGCATWKRILNAVNELQSREPPKGDTALH